jgi:hypothetical protein
VAQFNGVVKCLYVGAIGGPTAALGGTIHQGTDSYGNNLAGQWVVVTIRDFGRGLQVGTPDEFGYDIAGGVWNGGCYPGSTPFEIDQGNFIITGSTYNHNGG